MILFYTCLFACIYFNNLVESLHFDRNLRRGLQGNNKNHNFADAYYYNTDADYSWSRNGKNLENAQDYGAFYDTHKRTSDQDLKDFSSFSDADFSEALSKLSENELKNLDRLLVEEESVGEAPSKREVNYGNRVRRCQIESCSNNGGFSSAGVTGDSDQIASLRSWFSKSKTTQPTEKPTTSSYTRTTRRKTRTTRKRALPRRTKNTPAARLLSNNNDAARYGQNLEVKNLIDREILARISNMKNHLNKRSDESTYSQISSKRQKRELNQADKKQQIENSEVGGTLRDSFPEPNQGTASFHTPLERLVRVKRQSV
ncbi:uncharacterized protein LOC129733277 [Wyeomyia smithii]|uniref:uncharacterized protein LOC129733277 n=1 Tax=Wyeomyia smithii TaxID=174621 RepID=UPI002467BB4E|nr:uncharacterized protein LOC129733277 [Wyeomyia smithii]